MNRSSKMLVGDGKPHERRHPLEGGGVRITTFVPFHFKKRGIKKVIVAPDGVSQPVAVTETPVLNPEQDRPLLKALGRPAQVVEFPAAGHDDLSLDPAYWSAIGDFLAMGAD